MELTVQQLTPDFCVAPQLTPEAMASLAAAGFKSVINNRPDFEGGPDQPTSEQVRAAAEAAGLVYRHLPVQGGYQSPEEIAARPARRSAQAGPGLLPLRRALHASVRRRDAALTGSGLSRRPC